MSLTYQGKYSVCTFAPNIHIDVCYRIQSWNLSNISKAIIQANRLNFDVASGHIDQLTLQDAIGNGRVNWVLQKLTEESNLGNNLLLKNEIIFDSLCLRKRGERLLDSLSVTPFHYAILSHQTSMVQMMLEFASKTKTFLKRMIAMTTKVEFCGKKEDYYKDDISLDGINAIHLATKFHVKSLFLIIQCLLENNLMGEECVLQLQVPF